MKEPGGFIKVDNLFAGKIRDKHKKLCPPDLCSILRKAGVVSFSSRPDGLDWDVVRNDALVLCERLGKTAQKT